MLNPIRSNLLGDTRHGFFTREGGCSRGIYASLNGGSGSRDSAEAVDGNRRRIREAMGAETLLTVHQIHSDIAHAVAGSWAGPTPNGDALVSATPGIAVAVLVADCTPVLFADREHGVVGAAHAGWKGALGGILEKTLARMEELGARRRMIVAALGPTISQRAYEVGPEFVERFLEEDAEHARFFAGGQGDRALFDLPGFCLSRLRRAGVAEADWTGHCTYSDPARFYSYRRACHQGESDYGRLVAAIAL